MRDAFQKAVAELERDVKPGHALDARPEASFFWRIKDPSHADLARVLRLLEGVREGELEHKARHGRPRSGATTPS